MENNIKNILYMELDKLLADIEKMKNDPKEATEAFEAACKKVSIKRKSLGIKRINEFFPKVAAALFLPLAAGLIALWTIRTPQDPPKWSEVYVPNGEIREITLPDGTELTLNAGSRITYPDRFEGNTREIFLDGELMADVSTDKSRPFIIHAGDNILKVLGTKFTFKTYKESDFSEVMLLEGSVQLELKTEECTRNVLMQPGEHVRFNKSTGLIETRTFQEDKFGMFASGTALSFWNMPLGEVAKDLEHTFNERILVLDNKVSEIRILAFFTDDRSCADILSSLEATYPEMKVENISGTYYISSK